MRTEVTVGVVDELPPAAGAHVVESAPVEASNAASEARAMPLAVVNAPPAYTTPPPTAIEFTAASILGLKPERTAPVVASTAPMRDLVDAPSLANVPPI